MRAFFAAYERLASCGGEAVKIQGQLLRISARREVAIYLRDGTLWIADFVDGCGELFEPEVWFRFNCGSQGAPDARRRMLRESGLPLSRGLVMKIESLHLRSAAPNPLDSEERQP